MYFHLLSRSVEVEVSKMSKKRIFLSSLTTSYVNYWKEYVLPNVLL